MNMDERSALALKEILKKEIAALSENDIAILRARIAYLGSADLDKYQSVLFEESSEVETTGLTYHQLQEKGRLMGLPVSRVSKEKLLKMIEEAESK